MSEPRVSPFHGLALIRPAPARGMILLRGDLQAKALRSACAKAVGADFPATGGVQFNGQDGLMWLSPDELLILTAPGRVAAVLAGLEKALGASHVLLVDVSDARRLFAVEGTAARDVLAKLTPADLRPGVFDAGVIRRTRLGQVAAALWMPQDGTIEVMCFASVAEYMWDLLCAAANPQAPVGHL